MDYCITACSIYCINYFRRPLRVPVFKRRFSDRYGFGFSLPFQILEPGQRLAARRQCQAASFGLCIGGGGGFAHKVTRLIIFSVLRLPALID